MGNNKSWTSGDCFRNDDGYTYHLSASADNAGMMKDLVSYLEANRYDYDSSLDEVPFEEGGGIIAIRWHNNECPFILIDEKSYEWIFVD